jgi:O-antigen/teichoic acid export membrane protein
MSPDLPGEEAGPRRRQGNVRRFAINAVTSVLATLISMTVLVWVNQYLLRRIPAEEYQLVPVVTSLLVVGEIMRNVFSGGLSRFMVEAKARGDHREITRITSSMLPVLLGGALLIALAGALAVWRIDLIINVDAAYLGDARLMFALLLVTLCLNLALSPFSMGLYVDMRFVTVNLIRLGCEVLRIAVLLGLLFAIGTEARWVVVASTVGSLADLGLRVAYSWKILPEARFDRGLISGQTVRRLMSFSAWTSVQGLTSLVNRMAPVLLLNHNATAVDVTAFYLGQLPDTQIRKLTSAATRPAQPELTSIYATEGAEALQPFYYRGGRYFLWAALLLVPPLLAFAFPLIRLYVGETYISAAYVLIGILGVYPLTWASGMFYVVAYATGRIEAFNICALLLSVVLLALLVVFVAWQGMGALGAAWAFGLSFGLVHLLVIWPLGLRMVKGTWGDFLWLTLVPGIAPALAATAVGLLFEAVVPITSWAAFIAAANLTLLAYAGTIALFCKDPKDRELLARLGAKLTPWRRRGPRGPAAASEGSDPG